MSGAGLRSAPLRPSLARAFAALAPSPRSDAVPAVADWAVLPAPGARARARCHAASQAAEVIGPAFADFEAS